jgi:hypothetical protein
MEEEEDGIITSSGSSVVLVDPYCHEAPLVSTPSMTPAGPHGGDAEGRHQQQQAQDLPHLLDDNEDLVLMMMARQIKQRCHAPGRGYLDSLMLSASSGGGLSLSCARSRGVHYIVYVRKKLDLLLDLPCILQYVINLMRIEIARRHLVGWVWRQRQRSTRSTIWIASSPSTAISTHGRRGWLSW